MVKQNLQCFLRVFLHEVKALAAGTQEFLNFFGVFIHCILPCQKYQLIALGNAVIGGVEIVDIKAFLLQLRYLVVYHVACGCIHLSGCGCCQKVEADIYKLAVIRRQPYVFQHRCNLCLGKSRTAITDFLACQILRTLDAAFCKGNHNIQRALCHCTDRNNRNIFLYCRLDCILQIVNPDIRLACRRHGNAVICVGRKVDNQVQSLVRKIALLLCYIQEGVNRIGIPVQNNVKILQSRIIRFCIGSAAAACRTECQHRRHAKCHQFLFHSLPSPFVPRAVTALFSM